MYIGEVVAVWLATCSLPAAIIIGTHPPPPPPPAPPTPPVLFSSALHRSKTRSSRIRRKHIGEEPSDSDSFKYYVVKSLPPVKARSIRQRLADARAIGSSDSADSADSVDSSFDSSESSDPSVSPPPHVRGQGVRQKKLQPKDPRVSSPPSTGSRSSAGPGLRKPHGLRGTDGGSESQQHGSRGHHGNFKHASGVQFNGRYRNDQHQRRNNRYQRHRHGRQVELYFLEFCLWVQVVLPIALWVRRIARESIAAAATSGDQQAMLLVKYFGAVAVGDAFVVTGTPVDNAVVVTGTPVNPPPPAHV